MAKVTERRRVMYYCGDCGHEKRQVDGFLPQSALRFDAPTAREQGPGVCSLNETAAQRMDRTYRRRGAETGRSFSQIPAPHFLFLIRTEQSSGRRNGSGLHFSAHR